MQNSLKDSNIVFLHRSKNIGGIQVLYSYLAESLIKKSINVTVLDYGNGYVKKTLSEKGLDFKYHDCSESGLYNASENDILVISISFLFRFKNSIILSENTKFLFWDFHPHHLLNITVFAKYYRAVKNKNAIKFFRFLEKTFIKRIKYVVSKASEYNALYFMSHKNYLLNQNFFNFVFTPKYLPVPVKIKSEEKNIKNKVNHRVLNICWISRLDKDKVDILKILIDDIIDYSSLKNEKKIVLHIIGDGSDKERVEKSISNESLHVKLLGRVSGEELQNYITNNIDVGFSVGMAALEFASCRIPTVLMPSITEIDLIKSINRRYLWLHESKGYGVSIELWHYKEKTVSFNTILDDILSDGEYYGRESYSYVIENHEENMVFNKFIKALRDTSLTYDKFDEKNLNSKYPFSIPFYLFHLNYKKIRAHLKNL